MKRPSLPLRRADKGNVICWVWGTDHPDYPSSAQEGHVFRYTAVKRPDKIHWVGFRAVLEAK